jgi:hypothetical protein
MKTYELEITGQPTISSKNLDQIEAAVLSADWSKHPSHKLICHDSISKTKEEIPIPFRWLAEKGFTDPKKTEDFAKTLKLENWLCHLPGFWKGDKPASKLIGFGINVATKKGLIKYKTPAGILTLIPSETKPKQTEVWLDGKKVTTVKVEQEAGVGEIAKNVDKLKKTMEQAIQAMEPS